MQIRARSGGVGRRRLLGAAVAGTTLLGVLTVGAAPAGAVSLPPEVVAEGLDSPYKLNFGPDGHLYVTEAGVGGDGPCVEHEGGPDGEGGEACYGPSGAITRVEDGDGAQSRVVEGLPSIGDGDEAIGAADVEVATDGTMYVAIGLGGNVDTRAEFGEDGALFGTILRIPPGGGPPVVHADLAQFEADEDPDADQPGAEGVGEGGDSNPFGIELLDDGTLLAVDAGGNTLLEIPEEGMVELVTLFPFREAEAPPFLELPPGTMIPMQPVPTSVEVVDGMTLVSELTGFPFPPGEANIYEIVDGEPEVAFDGFSTIVDMAADEAGNVYVAELAHSGLLADPPDSRINQIRPDGTVKTLLTTRELGGAPTGVTTDAGGMLYVAVGLGAAGEGKVIRVDPADAADPVAEPACPPVDVPGTTFLDIGESVHRETIECLAWWGVTQGVTAESFMPMRQITRGEMASLVARLLESAGLEMPADPDDAFPDDDGSVHELRINQLAELGIVQGYEDGRFRPTVRIDRAQLAACVVRAYETMFDELPAGVDAFDDDDGDTHEAHINAAAEAGWVRGKAPGVFDPHGPAQRDQAASVLARMLGTLVVEQDVMLPS
jgi:hypothetical protein